MGSMRSPKSRPSRTARSCRIEINPSMRRVSSSSWESRPVTPMDKMASATTMAMITTTTRISTSVNPRRRRGIRDAPGIALASLTLLERRGADVGVVAFAARLAVAAVADDVVVTAFGTRTRVLINVVPRILGERRQVAAGSVIGDAGIRGLADERLQPLFGGRVFEVIQPIQVERRLNGADIALGTGHPRLVDILQYLWHHECAQHCENDDHDHDLDEGETALTHRHSDLGHSLNDTKREDNDAR